MAGLLSIPYVEDEDPASMQGSVVIYGTDGDPRVVLAAVLQVYAGRALTSVYEGTEYISIRW